MNIDYINIYNKLSNWFLEDGIYIVVALIVTWIVSKFLKVIIVKTIRKLVTSDGFHLKSEEKKREDTLISIFNGFFGVFIWIVALVFILERIGVPITPLITGAGIIGVAVGFGSQSLVRDIINGIFIISENQFRIQDVVEIAGRVGTVEAINLRITSLRELNGTIHYIPNGEINIVSNKSKDYSMVDLIINVSYETKIDRLEKIINEIGASIASEPGFKEHIIETPTFLRIQKLDDYSIAARVLGKVYPKMQFLIEGELRKRIKVVFEKENIDIPYPTSIVHIMKGM